MINKDSIVTAYDEHLTLVEWLQKVEKLLANGGVKDVKVNQVEEGFQFVFIYNDDTTMTSNPFKLGDVSALIDEINEIKRRVDTAESNILNIENGNTHLFENITDKHGNKRFVEGNITMNAIEGVTQTYGKWSLSGTHLMIVIAGTVLNGTILNANLANIELPTFIYDKVKPIYTMWVDRKQYELYASEDGSVQSANVALRKRDNTLNIIPISPITTLTDDRAFRIQFDLLIDDE